MNLFVIFELYVYKSNRYQFSVNIFLLLGYYKKNFYVNIEAKHLLSIIFLKVSDSENCWKNTLITMKNC